MAADKSRNSATRLGDLEEDVMSVVWEKGQATVQDVKEALEPRRPLAYTTVMTVLSRLATHGYQLSPGTLYPILHGMERDGFLRSEKQLVEGKIRKNYYITILGTVTNCGFENRRN